MVDQSSDLPASKGTAADQQRSNVIHMLPQAQSKREAQAALDLAAGTPDAESIKKLTLSLQNIVAVLQHVFQKIEELRGKDLVIMLGNPADGKSSVLASLIHGPDSLQEKTLTEIITFELEPGKFKDKKIKTKAIEFKEGVNSQFVINHSKRFMTFIPVFEKDTQSDLIFVDVGGFNDDEMGALIEIINTLTLNHIFSLAKSVRFLVTHTQSQIERLKGLEVKNYMSLLRSLSPCFRAKTSEENPEDAS